MKKTILTLALMLSSVAAQAEFTITDGGKVDRLPKESAASLQPAKGSTVTPIKYNYRLVEFNSWSGTERKVLNLFETFKPAADNPLIMYVGKISVLINKPADKIDMSILVRDIEVLRRLDKMVVQTVLKPNDVISYIEPAHAYRNPPNYRWCDGSNTLCLKSLFKVPEKYEPYMQGYFRREAEKKKIANPNVNLEGQSELRVLSGKEIANAADLQNLTEIKSPPASVLTQNVLWFSHGMEYTKIVAVVQPNPSDKGQSIVTTYMTFGIQKRTWDKTVNFGLFKVGAEPLILGNEIISQPDGIMAGLPKFTMQISKSMIELFAK